MLDENFELWLKWKPLDSRYTIADNGALQGFRTTESEFDSYFGGCWHKNRVWTG